MIFDRLEVSIKLARILPDSLASRVVFFSDIKFSKTSASNKLKGLVFEILLGRLASYEIGFLIVSLLGPVIGFDVEESRDDLIRVDKVSLGARGEEVFEFIKLLGTLF